MVAEGSLWNVFWSLIDDAALGQNVAATKQALPIQSRWNLQSPRILEGIFSRFSFANHHHAVKQYPNSLSNLSCFPPLHELFLMKLHPPWTFLVDILGSFLPNTGVVQSSGSFSLSRRSPLLSDSFWGRRWECACRQLLFLVLFEPGCLNAGNPCRKSGRSF